MRSQTKCLSEHSEEKIDFDTFTFLMDNYVPIHGGDHADNEDPILRLRQAFSKEARTFVQALSHSRSVECVKAEPTITGYTGMVMDTVPAFVIILNCFLIGLSLDMSPDAQIWNIVEVVFTCFFFGEFVVKVYYLRWYFFYGKDWTWNVFDLFCLSTAIADQFVYWGEELRNSSGGGGANMEVFMLLKILRLARIARILRLMRFKVFLELRMMIEGVITGMRVLFWAIVLLMGFVYFLSTSIRMLIMGPDMPDAARMPEFDSVAYTMLTVFRCFTDSCTAHDGSPLQFHVWKIGGAWFLTAYFLLYLFVTIGIFNLIMAIFIENVLTANVKKKQQVLGEKAAIQEMRIKEVIHELVMRETQAGSMSGEDKLRKHRSRISEWYATDQDKSKMLQERAAEIANSTKELVEDDILISREVFNVWLQDPKMLSMLEEVEIETSTKFELFDVLDVDNGGELSFDELVSGLMSLRGPHSKCDIVAIRLKVRYMTQLVEKVLAVFEEQQHAGADVDEGQRRVSHVDDIERRVGDDDSNI